jgi:hypothetical protein
MKIIKTVADMKGIEAEEMVVSSISAPKMEGLQKDGKTVKPRVDGRPNREFVTISFYPKGDPLGETATRNFFQEHDSNNVPVWRGGAKDLQPGQVVNGKILRFETEKYFIPSENGKDIHEIEGIKVAGNWVTEYKTFATKGELEGGENTLRKLLERGGNHRLATDPEPGVNSRATITNPVTEREVKAAVAGEQRVKEEEKAEKPI